MDSLLPHIRITDTVVAASIELVQARTEISTAQTPLMTYSWCKECCRDLHFRPLEYSLLSEMTQRLEQLQREINVPSEEVFVAKVRGVEQERAQATAHIQEQLEEAAAHERNIVQMQVPYNRA